MDGRNCAIFPDHDKTCGFCEFSPFRRASSMFSSVSKCNFQYPSESGANSIPKLHPRPRSGHGMLVLRDSAGRKKGPTLQRGSPFLEPFQNPTHRAKWVLTGRGEFKLLISKKVSTKKPNTGPAPSPLPTDRPQCGHPSDTFPGPSPGGPSAQPRQPSGRLHHYYPPEPSPQPPPTTTPQPPPPSMRPKSPTSPPSPPPGGTPTAPRAPYT